ncbi:uncharacterized protein LOC121466831 [Drosophila elegans]|uniref:uncharacterized protein LOC121466831 n=1 Tax=Drosophila elegans TaxID=30023 RepID=UPI001BC86201|nr:uncharacterized protein LOC121466831 [Drosophila elegans]
MGCSWPSSSRWNNTAPTPIWDASHWMKKCRLTKTVPAVLLDSRKLLISRLLQGFLERSFQRRDVLYKPTVPNSGSKKGSHFLHGPWLRHPPNSCYTPWIHPQTSSTHYEAEAFSDSAKILHGRSHVWR